MEEIINKVWQAVTNHPQMRVWELAENLKLSPSQVFFALTKLVERGHVSHTIGPRSVFHPYTEAPPAAKAKPQRRPRIVHQWPAVEVDGEIGKEGITLYREAAI
jgi:predicted ArsR family transcriptional regulator